MAPDSSLTFSRPLNQEEKTGVDSQISAHSWINLQFRIFLGITIISFLTLVSLASKNSSFLDSSAGAKFGILVIIVFFISLGLLLKSITRLNLLKNLRLDLEGLYIIRGPISFPSTTTFKVGNHSFPLLGVDISGLESGTWVSVEFTHGTYRVYSLTRASLPDTPSS